MSLRVLPLRPKLRKRARPVRREEPVHISIKNYLEATLPRGWLVHHSRNGGLSKGENGRARALGCKRGYPDLIIHGTKDIGFPMPCVVPWSWLIEVKDEDGVVEPHQRDLHELLRALGFEVGVARSIDDARALVRDWGLPSNDLTLTRKEPPVGKLEALN